jgi:hypothetical protein
LDAIRVQIKNNRPEVIISLVVTAITTVTGYLSDWAAGDITFTVILLVAIGLWGYYGFLRIQRWRYRPADHQKWSRVSMPALWQAACIYNDIEPYRPISEGTPCYPTLQMLKSEHMKGTLNFETEDEEGWQRVRIEELRRLAERLGDKPKCLFPDETRDCP